MKTWHSMQSEDLFDSLAHVLKDILVCYKTLHEIPCTVLSFKHIKIFYSSEHAGHV